MQDKSTDSPSTTNKNPNIAEKTFALRYILSLVFGGIFVGCLLTLISKDISYIFNRTDLISSYYERETSALLISAILITGAAHILLKLSVKESADSPSKKYQKILSIIYCSIFSIVALFYAWQLLSVPIGAALAMTDYSGGEIAENIFYGVISLCIIAIVISDQLKLSSKISQKFYAIFMASLSVVALLVFIIFPAAQMRNSAYDSKLESDLSTLEMAIEDYSDEYDKLPKSLSQVVSYMYDDLELSLDKYEYTVSSRDSYSLCADFKTDTTESGYSSRYSFSSHEAGHTCFARDVDIDTWY